MKVARNQMGESNDTQSGDALQRPRETFEGSRGPLSPPVKLIRIKQSECPQNLAHLRISLGRFLMIFDFAIVVLLWCVVCGVWE